MKRTPKPDPDALGPAPQQMQPRSNNRSASRLSALVHDGVHVIVFSQRAVLDAFEVEMLGQELRSYIEQIETPRIVIDLGAVNDLSSSTLGMLISAKTAAEIRGGRVCLANVGDQLLQIFKIVKIHRMLAIHSSTDAAVKSITSSS